MVQEAVSSFIGTGSDKPAMVDVYNDIDPSIRTSLISGAKDWSEGLGGIYDKAVGGISRIGSLMKDSGLDLVTAKNRISGALKGSKSDLLALGSVFEQYIAGDLMGRELPSNQLQKANSVYNSIRLVMSSGEQTFRNDNTSKISGIVNFLSDLSGNPVLKMFDLGAEAAILRGVLEEVVTWGIPELIDTVFEGQPDSVKQTVIQRAAAKVSYTSDVEMIIKLMETAGTNGELNPRPLLADTPNFATLMLQAYTFVDGTTPGDYATRRIRLVLALDTLKPDWFQINRTETEKVYNLAVLSNASEHAQLALQTDTQYLIPLLTAPFYEVRSPQEIAREMYPGIAIV